MARPIEGIAPFTGKAAEWLTNYLARPIDPKKRAEREARDAELLRHIKPISEAPWNNKQ